MKGENIVVAKSFDFALNIISLYKELVQHNEYVLSRQLLRSGTSIGANIEEAIAAQSRKDFIAKMAIASKEARETQYWLRLLDRSDITSINVNSLPEECKELISIITAIVKTTQASMLQSANSKFKI
jgi:four helix bundle protein